mmetsp:Transcript_277/g.912  ORF Transcript_277/g.912 Transcript_277/m.912 type:complete len:278 (+) Transcript_277:1072-1905(+)
MQPRRLAHKFFLEVAVTWGLMEIQVSAVHFVCSLAGQDHLHSQRLDLSGEHIHRHGCSDLVPGLQMINEVRQSIQCIFDRKVKLVMVSSEEGGYLTGIHKVGGALETDGEALHSLPTDAGGDRRDQGRVEATGEEDAKGHICHKPLLHCAGQGISDLVKVDRVARYHRAVQPVWCVPPLKLRSVLSVAKLRHVGVTGREGVVLHTLAHKGLHLRCKVYRTACIVAVVHGADTHVVTTGEDFTRLVVDEGKNPHAVKHRSDRSAELLVEKSHHFAVTL